MPSLPWSPRRSSGRAVRTADLRGGTRLRRRDQEGPAVASGPGPRAAVESRSKMATTRAGTKQAHRSSVADQESTSAGRATNARRSRTLRLPPSPPVAGPGAVGAIVPAFWPCCGRAGLRSRPLAKAFKKLQSATVHGANCGMHDQLACRVCERRHAGQLVSAGVAREVQLRGRRATRTSPESPKSARLTSSYRCRCRPRVARGRKTGRPLR